MHDPDTQAVIDALDEAQRTSGLDQQAFARALGTSPSRYSTYRRGTTAPSAAFLMRARRLARALRAANESGAPTAISAAEAIQDALDRGEADWAFALALEVRDRIQDSSTFRPELLAVWEANISMRDNRWRTLLAAIISRSFEEGGRMPPRWTTTEATAEDWYPVESLRYSKDEVREQTPQWLAKRRIFIADRDMATA